LRRAAVHAVLSTVRIENFETAREHLGQEVIPRVSALPGFVHGYWLAPVEGVGTSLVLFETEEQARAGMPPVGSNPAPGVTIESAEVRTLAGNA
jgi:hypothetical protein